MFFVIVHFLGNFVCAPVCAIMRFILENYYLEENVYHTLNDISKIILVVTVFSSGILIRKQFFHYSLRC